MNEQAIQDSYNVFVSQGYKKSIDEFKKLINTNPQALKDSYDVFVNNGYSKSIDDYKALMGVSSKPAPVLKKKFLRTQNSLNNLKQKLWHHLRKMVYRLRLLSTRIDLA